MSIRVCPTCHGCGLIDSIDKQPWSKAVDEPHKREEVRRGERVHVNCPDCDRTGLITEPDNVKVSE